MSTTSASTSALVKRRFSARRAWVESRCAAEVASSASAPAVALGNAAAAATARGETPAASAASALQWYADAARAWDEAPLRGSAVSDVLERCAASGSWTDGVRTVGATLSDAEKLGRCFPLPPEALADKSWEEAEERQQQLCSPPAGASRLPPWRRTLLTADGASMEAAAAAIATRAPAVRNAASYAARACVLDLSARTTRIRATSPELRAAAFLWMLARAAGKEDVGVREMQVLQILSRVTDEEARFDALDFFARLWGPAVLVERLHGAIAVEVDARDSSFVFESAAPAAELIQAAWTRWGPLANADGSVPDVVPWSAWVCPSVARLAARDPGFLPEEFMAWRAATAPTPASSAKAPSASENAPHPLVSFFQIPYTLDTASKANGLQLDAHVKQSIAQQQLPLGASPYFLLRVRRSHLVADTMETLSRQSAVGARLAWRRPLKVEFVGEEGVDAGGVRKEYFVLMIRELISPQFGMFTRLPDARALWFIPESVAATPVQFELVGVLVGLAVTNRVLLDVAFPRFLWDSLLVGGGAGVEEDDAGGGGAAAAELDAVRARVDSKPTAELLRDLSDLDPVLVRGLQQLLAHEPAGDVESVYARNFVVTTDFFGVVRTHELVPGGSALPVTGANRETFVRAYARWALVDSVWRELSAFRRGFSRIVDRCVLRELMFNAEELELLVVGVQVLDLHALEASAAYDGGFDKDSPTVRAFWRVVHAFSDDQKRRLLRFVTGSDRVPIRGLSDVRLIVQRNGPDSELLPSSRTCFDVLLLPDYGANEAKLRERLELALSHDLGFGTM